MILTCLSAPDTWLGQEKRGADMARDVAAEIRGATRRKFRPEDKIRIILEDMISRLKTGKLVSAGRGREVKIPGPPKGPFWVLMHVFSGHDATGIGRDIT
jgi:hypothetical protein